MIKVVTWFRRKPGMSVEDFQRYWRVEHPKAVLQLPGLRKYVQNHVLAGQYAGGRQPFTDGIAETWWDDRDALKAHRDTPALANLLADEARFMDLTDRHSIVAEEVVVVNGAIPPGGGAKIITRLTRRADLDLESAQRYWRTNHAAVATHMHGIARYVQNHARPGGAEYPTMGMPFVWFDSAEALRANATSPELAATRADEPNFLGPDLPFVLVREEHII